MSGRRSLSGAEWLRTGAVVAVALSGGVDSAVAASTLLQSGYDVRAVHMVLSPSTSSVKDAESMARHLGLDLEVVDLSHAFEKLIIQPFIQAYACGETPSPCVTCNPLVKFGLLWEWARSRGADAVATGHYAGLARSGGARGPVVVRSLDRRKDQTYFLCRLQAQMTAQAVFPLAGMTKIQVKELAKDLGLPRRSESQEICFLAGENYRDFIRKRLGPRAIQRGNIVDTHGRVLGRHEGLINYTVGQRRGLKLPGPEPYYVLALDPQNNRLVIGTRDQTMVRTITIRDVVWNAAPPRRSIKALVQIRSRHRPAPALINFLSQARAEVVFDKPQYAPAAGQAAAIYRKDVILGGGWIERPTFYTPPL